MILLSISYEAYFVMLDLAIISPVSTFYLLGPTVGFETNREKNSSRKANKYKPLLRPTSITIALIGDQSAATVCIHAASFG